MTKEYKEIAIDLVKANKYISDDLNILKKHYTILLEYISELESHNNKIREEKHKLEGSLEFYKMKEKQEEVKDIESWFWK